MSVKSRYDRFIPLFGRLNGMQDRRVRLFIDELYETSVAARLNGRGDINPTDVVFSAGSDRLQNKFFYVHDANKRDNDVHSEWALFLYQLAARLGGGLRKAVTRGVSPDVAPKVVTEMTDRVLSENDKVLPIVHSLAYCKPGSIEQLVWLLLHKVAVLKDQTGRPITENESMLARNIKVVEYKNSADIISALDTKHIIIRPGSTGAIGPQDIGAAPLNITGTQFTDLVINYGGDAAKKQQLVDHVTDAGLKSMLRSASADTASVFNIVFDYLLNDVAQEFGYNIDKYFVSLMLEKAVSQQLDEESSSFFNDIPGDANKYFRKGPEGYLYERDGTPEGRPVHTQSEAFKNMKVDNKCLTTGAKDRAVDADGKVVTCAEYLRECLAGHSDGVEKCKRFMKHHEFWANAELEAKDILPAMVVKTLMAFGFNYSQYKSDVTGQPLWKVQDVDEWLVSLGKLAEDPTKNKLDKDEVTAIVKNSKLLGYLRMLVKRVNENPIILNTDYNGPNNLIEKVDKLNVGLLPRFGLKLHVPSNDIMSVIERTNLTVTNHINTQLRMAVVPSVGYGYGMIGGSANKYFDPIENASNILKYPSKQSWVLMEKQYEGLQQRLNMHNKRISSSDDKTIRNLIEKLRESEIKLTKTMLYAEKYAKLLEVFGVNDGKSVLSFDHLSKFVDAKDSYLTKVRERQNSLTSIIRTVAEAVAKESSNKQTGNIYEQQRVTGDDLRLNL